MSIINHNWLEDLRVKAQRWDFIERNATCHGGGEGFNIVCWVPVDHEDMGCGVDAAIEAEAALHTDAGKP